MPIIFLFSLIVSTLQAQDLSFLRNDREGETIYSNNEDKRAITRAQREIDLSQIVGAFDETVRDSSATRPLPRPCSFRLVNSFALKLRKINPNFQEMEGALIYVRTQNLLDDPATRILILAHKLSLPLASIVKPEELISLPKATQLNQINALVNSFKTNNPSSCGDEAYRDLHKSILKVEPRLNDIQLKIIFYEAWAKKRINLETYNFLETARLNQLQVLRMSLSDYLKKKSSLRNAFPLNRPGELSDFVTKKSERINLSRRQYLYDQYTIDQMSSMANIVSKLRKRLESPLVEIVIHDNENNTEKIPLDPMERFRLAIKLLRKETHLLSTNIYFAGRVPDYMDLILASYELGKLPAEELSEISRLEEIWNPTKTFWDKAGVWIRSLSSVATIALPPPFGFLPSLGIMVIEMTSGAKGNNDDPTVLF